MSSLGGRWPLRLLSVAIAVVLWLVYSYDVREESFSERAFDEVNLIYNTPKGLILLNPVSVITVRVSGPEDAIRVLQPFDVSATLNLEDRTGIQEVALDESVVARPRGVNVDSITPDRLSLELDREIEKSLRVALEASGEPAAGAFEGEHGIFPSYVTVVGPAKLLERRDTIPARVDISGRGISFDEEVTLDTENPLIRILGSSTARVQIVLDTPLLSSQEVNGNGEAAAVGAAAAAGAGLVEDGETPPEDGS